MYYFSPHKRNFASFSLLYCYFHGISAEELTLRSPTTHVFYNGDPSCHVHKSESPLFPPYSNSKKSFPFGQLLPKYCCFAKQAPGRIFSQFRQSRRLAQTFIFAAYRHRLQILTFVTLIQQYTVTLSPVRLLGFYWVNISI